ncbi:hypothetical protein P3W45_000029 [Vairimorpha bombi]|jgi:Xaa-Pro aminopeptidase
MEDLLNLHNIGAYINITADEHLNEYIGDSDKRVEFLTRFTGSNGMAITCKKNVLFTDSRYYIQAKKELVNYKLMKMGIDSIEVFLNENIDIKRVGLNPRHYSYKWLKDFKEKLSKFDIEVVLIEEDFVDILNKDKPKRTFNEIYSIQNYKILDFYKKNCELLNYKEDIKEIMLFKDLDENSTICGKTYQQKLENARKEFNSDEELIITEMDTICWLFNLRGSDIAFNPLFYSYAVISQNSSKLFCNQKINIENVEVLEYEKFETYIKESNSKMVVSHSCNAFIDSILTNHRFTDKIRELQSIKSKEELEGFHLAYILDGLALNSLFNFIDTETGRGLREIDVSKKLHEIKSKFFGYKFPSFESIVGTGENSAIIHYSPGDVEIKRGSVCLLDTGSNYIFGTTDTSRTLFTGNPSSEVKLNYTKTLKGQIRAMKQIYPHNINGAIIDSMTRLELWNNKENYGHASGHGVGHFLCVHESPPSLSYNYNAKVLLRQVFSVEPGIYLEGKFGIRLENLVYSQDIGNNFMKLVNLTYVPYQMNMIDVDLLDQDEFNYINEISSMTRKMLLPFMQDGKDKDYLLLNTNKLKN